MLLTLNVSSLRPHLRPGPGTVPAFTVGAGGPKAEPALGLIDVPRFAREELGLHGLTISTDLLAGADFVKLDKFREAADKASCPCLVLIENEPQPFGELDEKKGSAAVERIVKVTRAAHRLGCNSAALAVTAPDDPDTMDIAAERLRDALRACDRLEINLLLMSHPGLCASPDRLTDLIKRVGGFRIGTMPDFLSASKSSDPVQYLRRLTPYASAVAASVLDFTPAKKGLGIEHAPYNLGEYMEAVEAVGYQGTVAIDFKGKGPPADAIRAARELLATAAGLAIDLDTDDDALEDAPEGAEAEAEDEPAGKDAEDD
jgi:sugar phosphate isomerase/epimerase